jgi:hypothetical protein
MSDFDSEIDARINEAIDTYSSENKPNLSKIAREFTVLYQRLRARWNGRKSLNQRVPNGRRLTFAQEDALYKYIDYLNRVGASVNHTQIETAANSILRKAYVNPSTKPPKIGDHWIKRFLKRYPEYYRRRRRALDIKRKRAYDKASIES